MLGFFFPGKIKPSTKKINLIFRWNIEEARFEKIAEVPANTQEYMDQGLESNTMYRYKVQAINQGGVSDFSNEASATTLRSLPPVPEQFKAIAISNREIRIEWEDWSSLADKYEIYRLEENTNSFIMLGEVLATENTFLDDNLTTGTYYTYKIRAYNEVGYSGFSPEVSAYTLFASPNPLCKLDRRSYIQHSNSIALGR